MKRTTIILLMLLGAYFIQAQETDTTKIKLGDTKIIIIDKNKDPKENAKNEELARKEFEKMLEEKQKSLDEQAAALDKMANELEMQQQKLQNEMTEQQRTEIEANIQAQNEKIKEQNKKIEELNKEVAALEKGIEDLDEDFDKEDDEWRDDDEDDDDFEWNFKNDWPKDWDNLSPFGHSKKFRGHWAGFELGLNNYMNADNQFGLSEADKGFELNAGSSWMFALNFLEFNIPFGRHAGLVTGLGTTWNNYKLRNNVNVFEDTLGIMVATAETNRSYTRNSLHTWSFNVPLILEFQIPSGGKSSGIYMGIGVVGTAKVSSWGNIEYQLDGVKYEERRKSDFLQNSFRYGLTARLGLKYLRLFANYDLVPLFQKDRGPELYPVSVGITLLSF